MLGVVGCGDHREVGQPLLQPVEHIVAAAVPKAVAHQRKFVAEARDPARAEKRRPSLHHSQIKGAGDAVFHLPDFLPGLFREVKKLIRPAQQRGPLLGELEPPLAPHKERSAQLLLQQPELMAQRRLAHMELLRRAGDVQLLGGDGKIAQRPQIHPDSSCRLYHIKKIS